MSRCSGWTFIASPCVVNNKHDRKKNKTKKTRLLFLCYVHKLFIFFDYQPSTNVIPQLDSTSASDVEDEASEAPDGKGKLKNDKKTALKDKRKRSVDGQAFFACLRNFLRSVSSILLFIGMGFLCVWWFWRVEALDEMPDLGAFRHQGAEKISKTFSMWLWWLQ